MNSNDGARPNVVAHVVEALCDPHFRKQQRFGPSRKYLAKKVELALERTEAIELVALMFTRKNVNPLKRGPGDESTVDLAEIISLIHLNSFAALVAGVHPFGARLTILSEGKRFLKTFHLSRGSVETYQRRLRTWIQRLDLSHLRLLDYEDFLDAGLSDTQKNLRAESYARAYALYTETMGAHLHPEDMGSTLQHAIAMDPVKDPGNPRNNFVPLWDSIKHSIPYPFLESAARETGVPYETLYKQVLGSLHSPLKNAGAEALRVETLRRSWNAAIEHNARIMGDAETGIDVALLVSPAALRTTINPKPSSPYLGIYSVRETTSRVQPWHGTAYLKLDGVGRITSTVLTKLELEHTGAIPMFCSTDDGNICFYASAEAAEVLTKSTPTFNMSARA